MIELTWWQLILIAWIIALAGGFAGLMIGTKIDDYQNGYEDGIEDAKSIIERFDNNGKRKS